MNVSNAKSLFDEKGSWLARVRRSFMERIAAHLGREKTPADTSASMPKIVDIDTICPRSIERAEDNFECDVSALNAEIAHLEAGYRQLAGARLTGFPAQLVVTETALSSATSHARHRFFRIRQESQIRIHAIEAQLDMAKGTERLQLDARLVQVRQQFGECTSKLSAVCGPVDESTRS